MHFRNSFRISDSIHFMHDQSEFRSDPFQDRPGARTGQEWVEFMVWPFVALSELGTTAPAICVGAVVPISAAGGAGQPSYTVRTVGPDILYFRVTVSEFFSKNSY